MRPALRLATLSALLAACAGDPATGSDIRSDKPRITSPDATPDEIAAVAAANTAFAVDLYHAVGARPGNLIFSPYSVSVALTMTYAGARGRTAAEMADVLHVGLPDDRLHGAWNALDLALESRGRGGAGEDGGPFRLRVANSIWGQLGFDFQRPFLDTLAENYGAGLRGVDFAAAPEDARRSINAWVEDETEDRIPELLPAGVVTPDTRLVLTNAVYFNAAWKEPFDSDATRDAPFHLQDGTTASVPTMHGMTLHPHAEGAGYQAVKLPYDGEELSMVVIVPDDLAAFEAALTADALDAILRSFSGGVQVTLPKLDFDTDLPLGSTLQEMGMADAFSSAADFTGIAGGGGLAITDVVHKGFITVTERGTEAGAATGVVVGITSVPPTLAVDRPFLFVIRDEATGAVLFLGRVVDPRA